MQLSFAEIVVPVGVIGLVVLLGVLRLRKHSWLYCLLSALFYFYLLVLIGLTLFPIPILKEAQSRQPAAHILSRINLIPFNFGNLFELHPNVVRHQLAGNILLTIPFGLVFPALVKVRARAIPWLGILVGLSIETAQLLVSLAIGAAYRSVDINDVLLNAVGVMLGFGLLRILSRLKVVNRRLKNWGSHSDNN